MAYSSLAIANEFIRRSLETSDRPLTQMQLQKLVYFAHGWNLALNSGPLVADQMQAWDFGPVFPALYSALRKFGRAVIGRPLRWGEDTPFDFDDGEEAKETLLSSESTVIQSVWNAYGGFPAFKLSALTHEPDTPWSKFFESGKNRTIPDADVKAHFSKLLQPA